MDFRKVSRAELSLATGRSRAAVSYWLSGRDHPRPDTMDAILRALSLTQAEFYGPVPRLAPVPDPLRAV